MQAYQLSVVLGMHDQRGTQGKPVRYPVIRAIGHPGFGRGGRAMPNDIALLQLGADAQFNQFVQPIQMAGYMESFIGNPQCYITGWGSMYAGQRPGPNILQEANVDIWDSNQCNAAHGYPGISNQQVCVGKMHKSGGCHGDSGGEYHK